jgi:hypothetical protein
MPTVAVMLTGRAAQTLAADQIGTLATVRFCESVGALLELVAEGDVDAVVASATLDRPCAEGKAARTSTIAVRSERMAIGPRVQG